MEERGHCITILSAGIIGWITWALILFQVDPFGARWFEFLFFYLSLGLALIATFFLLGWGLRMRFIRRFRLFHYIDILWRQSALLTFLVIVLLLLQSVRLLVWWNALIFVTALVLLEYFFITYRKRE